MELREIISNVIAGNAGDAERAAFSTMFTNKANELVEQGRAHITKNLFSQGVTKE